MKNCVFGLMAIVFSIFFLACEDEVIPIPLPPSQPAANAPAEAETESQAPPPATEKPSEPAKTVKAPAAKEPAKERTKTVFYAQDGDIEQSSTGRYIIQVAVSPVEASAKKIIKKLAENGIKAYSAKVQDPAPEKGMVGTYYRVRIGFFDLKSTAEAFAKSRLEPMGYKWWVDRSRNDNIGSRTTSEQQEPFVVERIQEKAPKQMTEQERKDAERAAAIAAAKEEYKAIAKAATSAPPVVPPPKIPPKEPKAKAKPQK